MQVSHQQSHPSNRWNPSQSMRVGGLMQWDFDTSCSDFETQLPHSGFTSNHLFNLHARVPLSCLSVGILRFPFPYSCPSLVFFCLGSALQLFPKISQNNIPHDLLLFWLPLFAFPSDSRLLPLKIQPAKWLQFNKDELKFDWVI